MSETRFACLSLSAIVFIERFLAAASVGNPQEHLQIVFAAVMTSHLFRLLTIFIEKRHEGMRGYAKRVVEIEVEP